jgi:deazaflavin-dependent oxidoreductase (nitroreductase family)
VTYLAPPWIARRVLNPLAMRLGLAGARTLAVRGRRTGRELTVPVIPLEHGGARYLVSTRGEAHWVRNLRATGAGELRGRGGAERFRATEVPPGEREELIAAYRALAGRTAAPYFERLPDPADHPVFRIEPE